MEELYRPAHSISCPVDRRCLNAPIRLWQFPGNPAVLSEAMNEEQNNRTTRFSWMGRAVPLKVFIFLVIITFCKGIRCSVHH